MLLLQAMFTLAVEWGESDHNPVALVRKPRQGRTRAIVPLDPLSVERIRAQLLEAADPFSATLVSVLAYSGVDRARRSRSSGATSAPTPS